MNSKRLSVVPTTSLTAERVVYSLRNLYALQNRTLPLDTKVLSMFLISVLVIFGHFSSSNATAPATIAELCEVPVRNL